MITGSVNAVVEAWLRTSNDVHCLDEKSWTVSSQIRAFFYFQNNSIKMVHNFEVIFFIDRTIFWQKRKMYHDVLIEKRQWDNLNI